MEYFYVVIKHSKKNFLKKDMIKSSKVHMHIELIEKLFERYLRRYPDKMLDIDNLINNIVDSGFLKKEENETS